MLTKMIMRLMIPDGITINSIMTILIISIIVISSRSIIIINTVMMIMIKLYDPAERNDNNNINSKTIIVKTLINIFTNKTMM